MAEQTQAEWEQAVALRAMGQVRAELYLALRYLSAPLGALTLTADPTAPRGLAADGERLVFAPGWVLALYRKNRAYLPRAMLHAVLHCLFRHPWLRAGRDAALWGLACDIAVERVIDELDSPEAAPLRRPVGWLRQQTYAELAAVCKPFAAGPIYRALCAMDAGRLAKLQAEFLCDSHHLWPADPEAPAAQLLGRRWEQLGREMQLTLQQTGRQAGQSAGAQALETQVQAGRSRRAYADFLRRFAVWREEPRLDPDAFDPGYYAYGLRVYGDMPLIEPLESRESKKVRDFVIVLDTSESTAGELVRQFLRETFALLRGGDNFFRQCRVWVLQCDDAVRDEVLLTDLDDIDRFCADFRLVGGGGTDFRPAFARIDALRDEGAFSDLRGVLYFTDGKGTYPAKRPAYDTAFLFLEDGGEPPPVPPWAMRLVLQAEEFLPAAVPKNQSPLAAINWTENELADLPEL